MIERRHTPSGGGLVNIATRSDGTSTIHGYAAVFYREGSAGTQYQLAPGVVERIRHGAFTRAIREKQDVRGLFNHDPDNLLGRTLSGTCRLSVDSTGLKYEIDCDPNDPDHQRVIAKMDRGDLDGSSFAFRAVKAEWQDREGQPSVRWLTDLDLYDVGPVTYPAYLASSSGLQ